MSSYEISKSSLLSLKAEILRKEEDVAKAKIENKDKIKTIKKKTPLKNKGVEERQQNDLTEEEQDLLKLSKSKLEAKVRLYEKLSSHENIDEDLNRRYLVRFDKKNYVDGPSNHSENVIDVHVVSGEAENHFSDEYDEAVDPSEEWVEYTDCLGRSRKCLRKDLEYFKAKDASLMEGRKPSITSVNSTSDFQKPEENFIDVDKNKFETSNNDLESEISTQEAELLSGDMRREMLRRQWENEEEELKNKTDIHYQNVLFNEARQHGVGYYAFSRDEEERAKQQEALKKLREETELQQKKAQELKAFREKQLAVRMKAARNRRRARLGLPPEDEPATPIEVVPDPKEEEKKREKEKAEEVEKLLMEYRKRHVRPWDVGKEGVAEHYEMSQEEWNEKKRKERIDEFAPPTSYSREFRGMQSLECNFDENKSLDFSTKRKNEHNKKNLSNLNPYKKVEKRNEFALSENDDRLLQDYRNTESEAFHPKGVGANNSRIDCDRKVRNGIDSATSSPIINELEEAVCNNSNNAKNYSTTLEKDGFDEEENSIRRGVEIAPPSTFEYYGSGESKKPKLFPEQVNIAESIEAGLKFLRKQAERKGKHCVDDQSM